MRRALIVVGAGASVEYGIPTTGKFGEIIESGLSNDAFCTHVGGHSVYLKVREALASYYESKEEAHFERIYHVLHELARTEATPRAVAKYRPVMNPFLKLSEKYDERALRAAASTMVRVIYRTVSEKCQYPDTSLDSLASFLRRVEQEWLPRIYTTNYDDFILQATDGYFTGFNVPRDDHLLFNREGFWSHWNSPGLFHLHGSIHMGFPHPPPRIGDIGWFDSREDALRSASFSGSGIDRMDGTSIDRSPIVTGLDKLSRLQQTPFAYYYASLSRDAMEADLIFVLGSGLGDLHLNTWLREVRRARPNVPLLYVGWWPADSDELYAAFQHDYGELEIALFHQLGVDLYRLNSRSFKALDGWTVDSNGSAAVWTDGFQAFLSNPGALEAALEHIGATLLASDG